MPKPDTRRCNLAWMRVIEQVEEDRYDKALATAHPASFKKLTEIGMVEVKASALGSFYMPCRPRQYDQLAGYFFLEVDVNGKQRTGIYRVARASRHDIFAGKSR